MSLSLAQRGFLKLGRFRLGTKAAALAVLLLVWEAAGRADVSTLLPPFSQVIGTAWELFRRADFYESLEQTLAALVFGLLLSLVAGTLLAVGMVECPWLKRACLPFLNALQTAPLAALVPLFMLLFGVGYEPVVAVVVIYTFFAIVFNAMTGFEEVDPQLLEMARAYGADTRQLWRAIRFPAALPMIFAGFRMAVGLAIKGVVIGEMLISIVGLGGLIMLYGSSFAMKHLFALILFLIGLSVLGGGCVNWLERHFLSWRRSQYP